jgi:hypothetical protein
MLVLFFFSFPDVLAGCFFQRERSKNDYPVPGGSVDMGHSFLDEQEDGRCEKENIQK